MDKSRKVIAIDLNDKREYQRLLAGIPQTCGMHAGRVYLEPNKDCGQHSTEAKEELLVFLSGKGTAIIGEEEQIYNVGRGKVVYIPPHTTHNIKNTGSEPLIYVYCVTPVKNGS